MAKVITFGIQKGGVGKSTTTGVIAHLMSLEQKRVLVIDMDSQGNVTDLVTQMEPTEFEGNTILEAFQDNDIRKYIIPMSDYLHIVPSDDYLATLAGFLYTNYKGNITKALSNLIEPIKGEYDYILIDTPPSLSEPMTNSVCASDYVVILAESSKWAFTAIPRFLETITYAKKNINPNLQVAGILRTMNDARRSDSKYFVNYIGEEYSDLVFDTVIKRKAAIGRVAIMGLFDNDELNTATEDYKNFYQELVNRIGDLA